MTKVPKMQVPVEAEGRAFFDRLRAHLRASPSRAMEPAGLRFKEAAILAPLFWRGGEPWAVLTQRPMTLRKHPGQISFPGGGRDPGDVTPLHTALREMDEELGVPPSQVEVLGLLGAMPTVTGYQVTPFVGVMPADLPLVPNPVEVEAVLEAPLWRLRREIHTIYQAPREAWVWGEGRHRVWGATFRWMEQLMAHVEAVGR